jgi:hypothetical protein
MIRVLKNELPTESRRSVATAIAEALSDKDNDWTVSMTSDSKNNAWDIEVRGPKFHWTRRFSGKDRDPDVIAEAMRGALEEVSRSSSQEDLNDALSALAIQGIAFTSDDTTETGERKYVVDRVELKESEIVFLYSQGALTTGGIKKYLLTRG